MKLILLAIALLPLASAAGSDRRQLKYSAALDLIRNRSMPADIPILKSDPDPLKLRLTLQLRALDARDNMMRLTVVEKMSWKDQSLTIGSILPDVNFKNVSTPREYIWTPDLELINSAEQSQRASPARAVVSEGGIVKYEPLYINAVPAVSPQIIPAGVRVSIQYKSSSYKARDLIFEQPKENGLDLSQYKSIGYVISDVQVQVQNPRPEERDSEQSRIVFSFLVRAAVPKDQDQQ